MGVGTGSKPEGPGYQGRSTRLRGSCPGVREWLGRVGWGTLEPSRRSMRKMLKAAERCSRLAKEGPPKVEEWCAQGTAEGHRWGG